MFRTGLGVTPDRANALLPRDGSRVGEVQAYVCDRIGEDVDPEAGAALVDAHRVVVESATETLGGPGGEDAATGSVWWDLPSGGRIAVKRLDKVVIVAVLSAEYADVERSERRLGISPDRVTGPDDDPV